MKNIEKFIFKINDYGEKPCIFQDLDVFTYQQLYNKILHYNEILKKKNILPGDVVFILGDYSFDSISLFFSLAINSNIIVPVTSENKEEIRDRYEVALPNWTFNLRDEDVICHVQQTEIERHVILKDLISQKIPGLILYSSGSTGKPKAMVHNLENLLAGYDSNRSKGMNFLVFLMFDHIGGLNTLFNCLSMGVCITIPQNRNPSHISKLIQKNKINVLPASPTFLNLMLIDGVFENHELSSLKMITYGTEAMPETLLNKLKEKLPRVKFLQTFGTSETGIFKTTSLSSTSTFLKFDDPDQEYKIVDGELWLKSKTQVLGYINHSNESFTEDGWFKTGDIVEQTPDGFLRIVGRGKEVINVGGEKVMPAEVESIILELDSVLDCIVRPERNSIMGQVVSAEVVLKDGFDFKKEKVRIKQHCKIKLDPFKVPTRIIEVNAISYTNRFKKNRQL